MSIDLAEKRVRVLIADDHTLVAQGLASLIENDFVVVATVENGRDFLKAAAEHLPDIALLDISMPDMTGLEAARELFKTTSKSSRNPLMGRLYRSMSRPVSLSRSKSSLTPTSGDSRKNCTRLFG